MSRFWQMVIFFGTVTLASAVGVLAPFVLPGIGPLTAGLLGAVLFLGCALLQESLNRRAEQLKEMRRMLLLKRALDRNRAELEIARDEIRRLFEALEADGGERLSAALEALSEREAHPARAEGAGTVPGSRPARQTPREDPDEAAARALLDRMTQAEEEADPHAGGGEAKSARSMAAAQAEVRVLHTLVEQLYAGREKPPVSLSEESTTRAGASSATRREPSLGAPGAPAAAESAVGSAGGSGGESWGGLGGGLGRGLRAGLRVVGGSGGRGAAAEARAPEDDEDPLVETLRDALANDRVDLYLQPIVSLPQRKRRFYECFSRIRAADGTVIGPERYIGPARQAGLLSAVDNMLLFRCVQLLRKLRRRDFSAAFFCNIAPHTLSDREFFRDFIEYMESHSELAPNLVLEFTQGELGQSVSDFARDLGRLGALGYRFSLDRVTDLSLDLDRLEDLHFAFLKIDAETVLDRLQQGGEAAAELRALKQEVDRRGIDLIVERIETEATLVELLDFNIDFGQGYLFGEPRLSKEPPGS
jgi:cyclic-di-GMP phosphodiesterase TipF (flagellum assembly factor)